MKATFNLPDDLYREVKARSALEGRTVKNVVVELFRDWLGKDETSQDREITDWASFSPPLKHLIESERQTNSMEEIRESIVEGYDEPL